MFSLPGGPDKLPALSEDLPPQRRHSLTVVRTASGLTAAIVRKSGTEIGAENLERSETLRLTVLSCMYMDTVPTFTFETHQDLRNIHFIGSSLLLNSCDPRFCEKLMVPGKQDGLVHQYGYGSEPIVTSQDQFLADVQELGLRQGEWFAAVGRAAAEQDVFRPGNSQAAEFAATVLRNHELLSQAAREAFGLPDQSALSSGGTA